eukprot:7742917-Prorocentrum_lima.AAC.1
MTSSLVGSEMCIRDSFRGTTQKSLSRKRRNVESHASRSNASVHQAPAGFSQPAAFISRSNGSSHLKE